MCATSIRPGRAVAARSAAGKGRGPRATRAAHDIKPHAGKAAALLKALANEQRLMIVCNLAAGPLSVGESIRYSLPAGVVTRIIEVLYKELCGR